MTKLIKNIFSDIFFMYKNFIHFNISKILIFLVAILYSLIWIIPWLLFIWAYKNFIWNISVENIIYTNIFYIIISFVLLFIAFVAFMYSYVLLIRLVLKYFDRKKLKYKKNYYFNFKFFWNYVKLFLLNIIIVFIPFLVAVLFIFWVIWFLWVENINAMMLKSKVNFFSVSSVVLWILAFVSFIYLSYKTLWALVIFVDESKWKEFKKSKYYIKRSFEITKWFKKFIKFVIIWIIIWIFSLPINYPLTKYQNNYKEVSDYISMSNSYRYNFSKEYIDYLIEKFNWMKKQELDNLLKKYFILYAIFEVLYFLFLLWVFEMFLVSFYKRELKS